MAERQDTATDHRQVLGHPVPTPPDDDVRALLRSTLKEPDLSAAVQAVRTVVRDFLREAARHGGAGCGPWPSVRLAASLGVPAAVLERSLWQAHLRLVDGLLGCPPTGPADAAALHALTFFTVHCCEDVTRAYSGSYQAARSGQDRRPMLVRMLADGGEVDFGEVERVLGVRCSDHHWATVLWSVPDAGLEVEDLVRFALTAARAVDCPRPLVAVDHASEVWMWTRWSRPPKPEAIAAACGRLRLPDGLRVCSGPVVRGLSGFRRSLLGAQAMRQTVGAAPEPGWHHYSELSPVSLLTADHEQAQWFVEDVLGELGRNEAWCATLRETLRLYLARGRSRQQVAAAMYINRNTVAYRVEKAAQLIGRPIDEDTFDLRLALEIARIHRLPVEGPASVTPA